MKILMFKAIAGIIDKVLAYFTPEERKRKLRDELDKLEEEKAHLIITKATYEKANRMAYLVERTDFLKRLLSNY